MSEASIEPAAAEHLPAIRELAASIWRAHYPGIISREQIDYMLARIYLLETMRSEIQSQGIHYDRLLLDGALIGFAAYGPTDRPVVWKVHKLYLLPAHHGCGLGSKLLRHCETRARMAGAESLTLNVNKQNFKAIAAYTRNGYATAQSVVLDLGNGYVMDDFVMVRNLR